MCVTSANLVILPDNARKPIKRNLRAMMPSRVSYSMRENVSSLRVPAAGSISASVVTSPAMGSLTAKPNLPDVPAAPITPLKPHMFAHYLVNHPDQSFVTALIRNLTFGADVGFHGPRHPRYVPNAQSARIHQSALIDAISKEVQLRHTVGPFPSPPLPNFVVNALAVRPKPNG